MPDRHSDEADAHVISKINANVTKLVGEIFGPRWGLRVGMILPALFAALFLYGGFTAHKHSQRLDFLIIGIFWGAVVLGVLVYSVVGDLD